MSATNMDIDNKRSFIRMKLRSEVALRAIDGDTQFNGACMDMSGSGLLIQTDAPFAVGDKVHVSITAKESSVSYVTEVMRVEEGDERALALSINEILD